MGTDCRVRTVMGFYAPEISRDVRQIYNTTHGIMILPVCQLPKVQKGVKPQVQ